MTRDFPTLKGLNKNLYQLKIPDDVVYLQPGGCFPLISTLIQTRDIDSKLKTSNRDCIV